MVENKLEEKKIIFDWGACLKSYAKLTFIAFYIISFPVTSMLLSVGKSIFCYSNGCNDGGCGDIASMLIGLIGIPIISIIIISSIVSECGPAQSLNSFSLEKGSDLLPREKGLENYFNLSIYVLSIIYYIIIDVGIILSHVIGWLIVLTFGLKYEFFTACTNLLGLAVYGILLGIAIVIIVIRYVIYETYSKFSYAENQIKNV